MRAGICELWSELAGCPSVNPLNWPSELTLWAHHVPLRLRLRLRLCLYPRTTTPAPCTTPSYQPIPPDGCTPHWYDRKVSSDEW